MAFDVNRYIDLLRRTEQDQSTVEGRLARVILTDPNWPYTASSSTQQARIDTVGVPTPLGKHNSKHGKTYDATSLKSLVDDLITRAS